MSQRKVLNNVMKATMVMGLAVSAALSGLFRANWAEASFIIEKKCMASQSRKKALSRRKHVCSCVLSNLQKKLDDGQTKDLEAIYKDRSSRVTASRDPKLKYLVDLDQEVNRSCALNPDWTFPKEDLGTPDPL